MKKYTPDQQRCIDTLGSIAPLYNLPIPKNEDGYPAIRLGEDSIVVHLQQSLSTYDSEGLTRLVLAAHANAVRVEITATEVEFWDEDGDPYETPVLEIRLNARSHTSTGFWERHPSATDLAFTALEASGTHPLRRKLTNEERAAITEVLNAADPIDMTHLVDTAMKAV